MNSDEVDQLGQLLATHRRAGTVASRRSCNLQAIDSLEVAESVQVAAASAYSLDRIGWTLTATSGATRNLVRADAPVAAPLFAEERLGRGDALRVRPGMLGIGLEWCFVFGRSFSAEDEHLDQASIAEAVASCHLSLQVLGRRVGNEIPLNDWTAIADFGLSEAIVPGDRFSLWRDHDIASMNLALAVDGNVSASGQGNELLGRHPFGPVQWLLRELGRGGKGLEAGDVVCTGSCTGLIQLVPGHVYSGLLGGDDVVELRTV